MGFVYIATGTIAVSGTAGAPLGAIINPVGSGYDLRVSGLVPLPVPGYGNPPTATVNRYNVIITSALVDATKIPAALSFDTDASAAVALVYTTMSHTLTEPSEANLTMRVALPLLQYMDNPPVVIPPGSTGVLEALEDGGGIPILFGILWEEVPLTSRVVHLASSTLPAAGAYTTTTAYTLPDGTKSVTFWNTYTRGAAGGYALHQVQWGNGTESAAPEGILSTALAITQPSGQSQLVCGIIEGPHPSGAGALMYPPLTVSVPAGVTTVRMVSAEAGVVGTPGTLLTAITTSAT